MRKIKTALALLTAVISTAAAVGCGSGKNESTESHVETVKVEDTDLIDVLPEDAEKNLVWMGTYDLNPKKGQDKSVEMTLFNNKGGTIELNRVIDSEKFDKLASAIMSNQNVPDIFKYEWLAFPCQVVKDMYQPVDSIVDFDSDLWADTKTAADQFVLNGEHYVAPISFSVGTLMMYDQAVIDNNGLDDPYELYLNGEWNWDAWYDMMDTFVSSAGDGEQRYGINGWFQTQIVQQTGKTMVSYDKENNSFHSNIQDPDIERAENLLYDIGKKGFVNTNWLGNANAALKDGTNLFYSMGIWAMTGTNGPKKGDEWRVVPMPSDPNTDEKYMTSDMLAYMWVKGSKKSEAVKCWYECCRIANTDETYRENGKQKFLNANPQWTEEMYQVFLDASSTEYMPVFDYGYGISGTLSDDNSNEDGSCVTRKLYENTNKTDDSGHQYTWAELRESYSATVDSELKDINDAIAEYLK
ncbi:MAG: ABC transporter substrate-binding protein [Oscillospiraceae bacterium]